MNKGREIAKIQSIINKCQSMTAKIYQINFSCVGLMVTQHKKLQHYSMYITACQYTVHSKSSQKGQTCGFHATHTDGHTTHDL